MDILKIFIFDDHPVALNGICEWFHPEIDFIEVSGTGKDVNETGPFEIEDEVGIIVLDLYLKQSNPYDNVELLRAWYPEKKIVIFTSEDSSLWKRGLFKRGISAYVHKWVLSTEFKEILRKVAAGENMMPEFESDQCSSSEMANSLTQRLDLTPSEKFTLEKLIQGKGLKEIAAEMYRTPKAIDKTLQRLRKKFNVDSNIQLLLNLIQRKLF